MACVKSLLTRDSFRLRTWLAGFFAALTLVGCQGNNHSQAAKGAATQEESHQFGLCTDPKVLAGMNVGTGLLAIRERAAYSSYSKIISQSQDVGQLVSKYAEGLQEHAAYLIAFRWIDIHNTPGTRVTVEAVQQKFGCNAQSLATKGMKTAVDVWNSGGKPPFYESLPKCLTAVASGSKAAFDNYMQSLEVSIRGLCTATTTRVEPGSQIWSFVTHTGLSNTYLQRAIEFKETIPTKGYPNGDPYGAVNDKVAHCALQELSAELVRNDRDSQQAGNGITTALAVGSTVVGVGAALASWPVTGTALGAIALAEFAIGAQFLGLEARMLSEQEQKLRLGQALSYECSSLGSLEDIRTARKWVKANAVFLVIGGATGGYGVAANMTKLAKEGRVGVQSGKFIGLADDPNKSLVVELPEITDDIANRVRAAAGEDELGEEVVAHLKALKEGRADIVAPGHEEKFAQAAAKGSKNDGVFCLTGAVCPVGGKGKLEAFEGILAQGGRLSWDDANAITSIRTRATYLPGRAEFIQELEGLPTGTMLVVRLKDEEGLTIALVTGHKYEAGVGNSVYIKRWNGVETLERSDAFDAYGLVSPTRTTPSGESLVTRWTNSITGTSDPTPAPPTTAPAPKPPNAFRPAKSVVGTLNPNQPIRVKYFDSNKLESVVLEGTFYESGGIQSGGTTYFFENGVDFQIQIGRQYFDVEGIQVL